MVVDQWQQYLQGSAPSHQRTGLAYVPELAMVGFTGADVRNFLQGYLTCDTDDLASGTLTPTALCNLQGRVVMNGWCAPMAEGDDPAQNVWLVLHASLVDRLLAFLRPYLMFSKTQASDLRQHMVLLASLEVDHRGGLELDSRRRLYPCNTLAAATSLWESLPHLGDAAWMAALTEDGYPLISAPVSETFLPQMLDLERLGAINFEKGCYLGQEVVARAQHRGRVKRRLARLTWQGTAPPQAGADIVDESGTVQGSVVQSAIAATASGPPGSGSPGSGPLPSGPLLAVLREQAPAALRQGDAHLSRVG
jgi:tRNA-modifying protein YgfZ